MPSENLENDWIIELNIRPCAMSTNNPPLTERDKNDSRIFLSTFAMTLAESFFSHEIDPYIREHIELEKECSKQFDLDLVWSDDVSLAVCFLASLAHHGEYSEKHLLERYFQWWMNGYMCPTGLCFTPRVHLKKSIDLFGETQAAEAMGYEVDLDSKTRSIIARPGSLVRLSPIAYFYGKHPVSQRVKIIKDCHRRMFGTTVSSDVFVAYVEVLVKALNGVSKKEILQSIQLEKAAGDPLNKTFFDLICLLTNDNDDITQGLQLAVAKRVIEPNDCKYLNPYDSDATILATLYLQLSAAIYDCLPQQWFERVHAKNMMESLTKWVLYQRNQNLHSV